MPYISFDRRRELCRHDVPETAGELNFKITQAILKYLYAAGRNPRYADFNAVVGVLECVKLELYRRKVAPYEDKKCEQTGDVYPE